MTLFLNEGMDAMTPLAFEAYDALGRVLDGIHRAPDGTLLSLYGPLGMTARPTTNTAQTEVTLHHQLPAWSPDMHLALTHAGCLLTLHCPTDAWDAAGPDEQLDLVLAEFKNQSARPRLAFLRAVILLGRLRLDAMFRDGLVWQHMIEAAVDICGSLCIESFADSGEAECTDLFSGKVMLRRDATVHPELSGTLWARWSPLSAQPFDKLRIEDIKDINDTSPHVPLVTSAHARMEVIQQIQEGYAGMRHPLPDLSDVFS